MHTSPTYFSHISILFSYAEIFNAMSIFEDLMILLKFKFKNNAIVFYMLA